MRHHVSSRVLALSALLLFLSVSAPTADRAADAARSPVPVAFGPNINVSAGDKPTDVELETTIAVNPKDPMNLVEGNTLFSNVPAHNTYSFSKDGGRSWTFGGPVPLVESNAASGDPALAADADGNFYYSYLDLALSPRGAILGESVVVARSTDGGRTFLGPSVVARGLDTPTVTSIPDKNYIGIDTWKKSPYLGAIYVAWTEATTDAVDTFTQIRVAVSRDRSLTWSSPIGISQRELNRDQGQFGAIPVVAPDGTVYVFWAEFTWYTGPAGILFSKSGDGGRSWTAPAAAAANLPSPGFFRLKNADPDWDTSFVAGILGHTFPTAAIAPDGTIFVAWNDFPDGSCVSDGSLRPPCLNADVRLSVSTNRGMTWSSPVKVSDESGASDQFMPWIATHPSGLLSLAWSDKRLDPNNINFDLFYTNTFDGATFLPNVRASAVTSLSGKGLTPARDYAGMAAGPDAVFPVWMQISKQSSDIVSAVGRLAP